MTVEVRYVGGRATMIVPGLVPAGRIVESAVGAVSGSVPV